MYNRYIPQSDGTYQRNRMQEAVKPAPPTPPAPPRREQPVMTPPPPPPPMPKMHTPSPVGITNFFRQLLPKNFDTADLLIILLLLLMAGDNEEEKANALLTMALYFLM